jgi:hypothetical protein
MFYFILLEWPHSNLSRKIGVEHQLFLILSRFNFFKDKFSKKQLNIILKKGRNFSRFLELPLPKMRTYFVHAPN